MLTTARIWITEITPVGGHIERRRLRLLVMRAPITSDQAMLIYQRAIDSTVGPAEGVDWWNEVRCEIEAVIAAPTAAAAADVITWWHQVWRDVGDTPARAAGRIRKQARHVLGARPPAR